MHTGNGLVTELVLSEGGRLVRITCPSNLVPAPGQYVLAGLVGQAPDSPVPYPLFYTESAPGGFIAAPLSAENWVPGQALQLRGPLGRGFDLPPTARRVLLVAWDTAPIRLRGLIGPALRQEAAVVLVCSSAVEELPDEVEVQPLAALPEVARWADTLAIDVGRENLPGLKETLSPQSQLPAVRDAQVLVRTAMPCAGLAECGVCALGLRSGWLMTCKDGPVVSWRELA